jgi:hypothetical protein
VRMVEVNIKSMRGAPAFNVGVEGVRVMRSSVDGRLFSAVPHDGWNLRTSGIGADGIGLELAVDAGKPFRIRVRERSYGLPALGFAARPPEIMAQPLSSADSTQSVSVAQFK